MASDLYNRIMWHGVYGHDDVVDLFRRAIRAGRLASTFLFVGPEGIGKRTLGLKLGQALLCGTNPESDLEPCDRCPSCQLVQRGTHPDLDYVARREDRQQLTIDLFLGDRDHEADIVPGQLLLGHHAAFERLPGQLHLLLAVEEGHPADLVEIQVQTFTAFIDCTSDLRRSHRATE